MCEAAQVTPKDHLFELGSGRGRLAFWADRWLNCTVTGVELNPIFVRKAQRIQRRFRRQNLSFLNINFLQAPLEKATVVYLYGTAFEKPAWPNIIQALKNTPPGTRIITVSQSLFDWGGSKDDFRLEQTLWISYVWGQAPVHIQTRRSEST